jgi:hypothetical protein
MKKYAILTFVGKGMAYGCAPNESGGARLNEGKFNSSNVRQDRTAQDLIRNEDGTIKQFVSQIEALNYCVERGWNLEQTIFESHEGFNSRDPLSSFIFILSRQNS